MDRLTTQLMNTMQTQFNQASQRQQLLNQRLLAVDLGSNIRRYQERLEAFQRLLISNMTSQYDSKLARFEKGTRCFAVFGY